ncbi:MAG TPA: hypothetical protein VMH83_13070, partial [Candidatus Acidoferrum sp.]|nr:hypothetical protein [Candidatus Acidoferrum sp.]
ELLCRMKCLKTPRQSANPLLLAVLMLVLTGIGHVHGHICLDGKEPPMTVHFENLQGAAHQVDEGPHTDIENELTQDGLPGKAPDMGQGPGVFLLAFLLLPCLVRQRGQFFDWSDPGDAPHSPTPLLPPLRAPPSRSH